MTLPINVPAVTCDFCESEVQAREEAVILEAQPSDRIMCRYCSSRLERVLLILVALEREELLEAEPATRLIC